MLCFFNDNDIRLLSNSSVLSLSSDILYAPLIHGCTSVLYEGKPVNTPDSGAFWRVASEYKARCIFSAPTAFRAIRKEDNNAELMEQYDMTNLKSVMVAGERCDPPTLEWLGKILPAANIVDNFWMTETGSPVLGNPVSNGIRDDD